MISPHNSGTGPTSGVNQPRRWRLATVGRPTVMFDMRRKRRMRSAASCTEKYRVSHQLMLVRYLEKVHLMRCVCKSGGNNLIQKICICRYHTQFRERPANTRISLRQRNLLPFRLKYTQHICYHPDVEYAIIPMLRYTSRVC